MTSKAYRWCSVPLCTNTSIKTPEKLFIFVPFDKKIRKKWLELARRDLKGILPTTQLYFCEDHFDLPNDMINYIEYHIMGKVSQVRMKPGCIPTKFGCQEDRRKRTCRNKKRPYMVKKERNSIIAECLNEPKQSSTPSSSVQNTSNTCSGYIEDLILRDSDEQNLVFIAQTLPSISTSILDGAGDSPKYTWRCDACRDAVSGPRYVCVECPHTYCATCEARGTHAQHYMLRVPGPRPEDEVQRIVKVIQKELADILSCAEPAEEEPEIKTEIKTEPEDIDPLGEESPKEQLLPNALEQTMLDIDIKAEYECFEEEETCVAEPVVLKPVASQPVVSQRVASQPVVSQRVASQPVVSQRVVSQRVASQPSTSQPVKSDFATELPATCVQPTFTADAIRTYKRTSSSLPQASAPKKSYITLDATSSRLVIQAAASTSVESSQTHEEASEFKPGITSNLQETRPQQGSRASKKSNKGSAPKKKARTQ